LAAKAKKMDHAINSVPSRFANPQKRRRVAEMEFLLAIAAQYLGRMSHATGPFDTFMSEQETE